LNIKKEYFINDYFGKFETSKGEKKFIRDPFQKTSPMLLSPIKIYRLDISKVLLGFFRTLVASSKMKGRFFCQK